jgi:hypothetical protein
MAIIFYFVTEFNHLPSQNYFALAIYASFDRNLLPLRSLGIERRLYGLSSVTTLADNSPAVHGFRSIKLGDRANVENSLHAEVTEFGSGGLRGAGRNDSAV